MRSIFVVFVSTLFAALLAPPLVAHGSPAVPADQISVEATFEKGGERPDQYVCHGDGQGPRHRRDPVRAEDPDPGRRERDAQLGDGEYEVSISAFVTKGGEQVDLAVIVKRGGVKTAAQATTIKLPL